MRLKQIAEIAAAGLLAVGMGGSAWAAQPFNYQNYQCMNSLIAPVFNMDGMCSDVGGSSDPMGVANFYGPVLTISPFLVIQPPIGGSCVAANYNYSVWPKNIITVSPSGAITPHAFTFDSHLTGTDLDNYTFCGTAATNGLFGSVSNAEAAMGGFAEINMTPKGASFCQAGTDSNGAPYWTCPYSAFGSTGYPNSNRQIALWSMNTQNNYGGTVTLHRGGHIGAYMYSLDVSTGMFPATLP